MVLCLSLPSARPAPVSEDRAPQPLGPLDSSSKDSGSGFCLKGAENSVYKPQPSCLCLSLLEKSKILVREAISVSFYSMCC